MRKERREKKVKQYLLQWIHSAVHLKIQKQTEFGMGNSKIIRIKIHYVLEAIAAFKVIFHFCLLAQIHTHTQSLTMAKLLWIKTTG